MGRSASAHPEQPAAGFAGVRSAVIVTLVLMGVGVLLAWFATRELFVLTEGRGYALFRPPLDPVRFLPGYIPEPAAQPTAQPADATPAVTKDDLPALSAPAFQPTVPAGRMTYSDLSRRIEKMTSDFSSLLESTALTSPANSLEAPSSTGPMCRA